MPAGAEVARLLIEWKKGNQASAMRCSRPMVATELPHACAWELKDELATAYQRIGDVQGNVMAATLGNTHAALES